MRLTATITERLVQFGAPPKRYAILSHTWDDDEVLYEDILKGCAHERKGYWKFKGAVRLAKENDNQYIWIDNCCIDKSSSAELSEAINSIFSWYQKSSMCYVYLSDFLLGHGRSMNLNNIQCCEELSHSRWFRRSWTL